MSSVTYKCPHCDGGLIFDPESQKFHCEYCGSYFPESELHSQEPEPQTRETHSQAAEAGTDPAGDGYAVLYSCPSCGAEIVTDETTAATECYYCHNPVVLSGRLEGEYRPDLVIPFAVPREKVEAALVEWGRKKRFAPHGFFSKKQTEKITGVYFPYWSMDCELDAQLLEDATIIRSWRSGDTEYTETKHFDIVREGVVRLRNLMHNALNKPERQLAEGVQPFELNGTYGARDFSMGYLSGFQAEKRNVSEQEFMDMVRDTLGDSAQSLLKGTVNGYSTERVQNFAWRERGHQCRYLLVPVWLLTYRGSDKQIYYYMMNGQTGKVCGKLPVSWKKLLLLFLGITLPLFGLFTAIGYFLS